MVLLFYVKKNCTFQLYFANNTEIISLIQIIFFHFQDISNIFVVHQAQRKLVVTQNPLHVNELSKKHLIVSLYKRTSHLVGKYQTKYSSFGYIFVKIFCSYMSYYIIILVHCLYCFERSWFSKYIQKQYYIMCWYTDWYTI